MAVRNHRSLGKHGGGRSKASAANSARSKHAAKRGDQAAKRSRNA